MKIVTNWHEIAKHAWSIRFILIAGVLTGVEALLPDLPAYFDLPPRLMSALSFLVIVSAFVARFVAQKKVSDNGE